MTKDELYLNINDYNFDSLVCQSDIQSAADIEKYRSQGYFCVNWTKDDFTKLFGVDTDKVFYTTSLGTSSLYFNRDTLAAMYLNLEFLQLQRNDSTAFITAMQSAIRRREDEVSSGHYLMSIEALAPAMRMDYFKMLLKKKEALPSDLYGLFLSTYKVSDYGFKNFDVSLLTEVMKFKTSEQKEETKRKLASLPDTLTIYRGGNSASTPYSESFSWSLDINIANFFAARRGTEDGYIAEGTVKKEDIIEVFLEDDSEQEVLVDPQNVTITSVIEVKGLEQLASLLPIVTPMYQRYREEMYDLMFAQASVVHGMAHEARVLLLSLLIAELLDLPASDRRILATAAIYHDTQRTNDGVDFQHGKHSKDYYLSNTAKPNPLVAFLCEYHCLPDNEAYQKIATDRTLSKNRKKSKLLYEIFKDADALDRVRFDICNLDLNMLRLPISKSLTLFARITLEQLKVDDD